MMPACDLDRAFFAANVQLGRIKPVPSADSVPRNCLLERQLEALLAFACGNAPIGSGAHELSNDLFIGLLDDEMSDGGLEVPIDHCKRCEIERDVRNHG